MSISNAINQHEYPIVASRSDVNIPASNTAAVITYAAGASGVQHCLSGVAWSYSATPTSGSLKIEDGSGNIVFQVEITAGGPGFIPFNPPKKGTAATAFILTLAAGGVSVSGKVNACGHWTEGPTT